MPCVRASQGCFYADRGVSIATDSAPESAHRKIGQNASPKNVSKKRVDVLLVERGFYSDVEQAKRAILAHEVKVDGDYASSPGSRVSVSATLSAKQPQPYVSRGGVKLKSALDRFHQRVDGYYCIDVGSSTGGFTDCLLQKGAAGVVCVDVNYGQLAWSLRQDERVRVFERTNIKTADASILGAPFDLVVADVSFIGLASLAPIFASLSSRDAAEGAGTVFIGLIKPQYESRRGEALHGVVHDDAVRLRVQEEVQDALCAVGFQVTGVVESPLRGPAGNAEYLIRAVFQDIVPKS